MIPHRLSETDQAGLEKLVTALRAQTLGPTVEEQRADLERRTERAPLPDVTIRAGEVAGVPVEWFGPQDAVTDGGPVIVTMHGGGYNVGSLGTHRRLGALLHEATGAAVLNVDYRLAPEHPYPAAVDDMVAVYEELLGGPTPAERTCFVGDSAGGGLAAATALHLKERGTSLPSGLAMLSPWLDLTCTADELSELADRDPICEVGLLKGYADTYLAGKPATTPLASPMHADLTGLPPVLIQVGSNDILMGDACRFALRAGRAHVPVTLETWPEMLHVWHNFSGLLESADSAIVRLAAWINGVVG